MCFICDLLCVEICMDDNEDWEELVIEGLYTKDGWTNEAIREATK